MADKAEETEKDAPVDDREEIAGDGEERVMGRQKDGPPPVRELWRVAVIGIPVMIAAWYIMKWLMRR